MFSLISVETCSRHLGLCPPSRSLFSRHFLPASCGKNTSHLEENAGIMFTVISLYSATFLQGLIYMIRFVIKVVLTSLTQSGYNMNVVRLTSLQQYCYIMTASVLLEQPCQKSDKMNKFVTSCWLQLVHNI